MNNRRKLLTVLLDHSDLLALMGGMVVCAAAAIALAVMGGFWYL